MRNIVSHTDSRYCQEDAKIIAPDLLRNIYVISLWRLFFLQFHPLGRCDVGLNCFSISLVMKYGRVVSIRC
ncbi:hypothetical protein H5410_016902 [Solanum commersonii]|uniref:Uncharacterized protein n=1 Tax=Solanum commersonii TaxID=4109 RepID=A0A9J5ZXL5_SOLCO|nr:hypothetical protein H5410_016902 [Solanum commersonii]